MKEFFTQKGYKKTYINNLREIALSHAKSVTT